MKGSTFYTIITYITMSGFGSSSKPTKIYFTLHTISDGQNLEYLGVYNTILHYGNRLYGKKVLIVNRSEIVGRPLAALLANDGATVYSVDINNIQQFTRGDDLLEQRHKVVDLSPEEYTLEKLAPNVT